MYDNPDAQTAMFLDPQNIQEIYQDVLKKFKAIGWSVDIPE
jgi:hypothetical protein